jgi:DNA-binding IclR family transcriptional regulator
MWNILSIMRVILMENNNVSAKVPDGAQAVTRAFSILELVLFEESPVRLTDITEKLDLHRNTTYRLVRTLMAMGYLEVLDGGYVAGPKTIAIGRAPGPKNLLLRKCEPHLQSLCTALGEVTNLGILNGDEVLYLGRWEDVHAHPGIYVRIGQQAPLYASALGKVLLAGLSSDERQSYYRRCNWTQYTSHTVASPEQLEDALGEVQIHGFAEDREELVPEIRCIAVPLRVRGLTIAAISVAFPASRFDDSRKLEYVSLLVNTADAISTDLDLAQVQGSKQPSFR